MLLIDDRENPKVINKLLMRMGDSKQSADGDAKVVRMKSADYRMGTWGIEAKEINDLYRSILGIGRSRTIISQLNDLQDSVEDPFLVVYGTKFKPFIPNRRPNAKSMAIEIARMKKTTQQFKMNFYQRFPKIRYMEFATMDEFVEWLVTNHTQLTVKAKTKLRNLPPELKEELQKENLDSRVITLSSVQGVSVRQAKDLLEKFGSIPKLLGARTTQKSIMEIQGIGREKARRILALRDSYQ